MKINIKVLTNEAFESIRKNSAIIFENIKKYPNDNFWIETVLGENIYETKNYLIDDFELKYSKNYSDVEYENGIILYEHLHNLPRYILCDNKFWGWIILEKAYKQSQIAMNFTESVVKNFWFEKTSRRSVMLNVMGRQYFKVELSIDEELVKDKYLLTKYLFTNHSIYKNFSYRNNCMLNNVTKAILRTQYYFSNVYNIKYNDILASAFVKAVSRLGSVKLIDVMTVDEIYRYLCKQMEPIIKEYINNVSTIKDIA